MRSSTVLLSTTICARTDTSSTATEAKAKTRNNERRILWNPQGALTIVSVTVRDCLGTTPAAGVADNVYVIVPLEPSEKSMPVSTSRGVASSTTFGMRTAFDGASNVTARVTPAGIGALSCATIFLELVPPMFANVYVVLLSTTGNAMEPAAAPCTCIVAGEPDTRSVANCAPACRPTRNSRDSGNSNATKPLRTLRTGHAPPVIVYVTTRDAEVTTPAAAVASSEYVNARPAALSFEMPVTTSTAVVLSGFAPELVAPDGAASVAESVRPVGMAVVMLAITLAFDWLVVTDHVAPEDVTVVGALPAVAVVMPSDGLPLTAIWLMAST